MAKSISKKQNIIVATTGADYISDIMDLSAYNCLTVQVVGPGTGAGTLTVEHSNDGTNFFSLGTATITGGLAMYATGSTLIGSQVFRVKVNVSAGTGTYTMSLSAKDLG